PRPPPLGARLGSWRPSRFPSPPGATSSRPLAAFPLRAASNNPSFAMTAGTVTATKPNHKQSPHRIFAYLDLERSRSGPSSAIRIAANEGLLRRPATCRDQIAATGVGPGH